MHATQNAKRFAKRNAKAIAKTIANAAQMQMQANAPLYYVVGTRGAYAMQTGNTVNAKNVTVYAVFDNAMVAANYVANNNMHLYAAVVMQ